MEGSETTLSQLPLLPTFVLRPTAVRSLRCELHRRMSTGKIFLLRRSCVTALAGSGARSNQDPKRSSPCTAPWSTFWKNCWQPESSQSKHDASTEGSEDSEAVVANTFSNCREFEDRKLGDPAGVSFLQGVVTGASLLLFGPPILKALSSSFKNSVWLRTGSSMFRAHYGKSFSQLACLAVSSYPNLCPLGLEVTPPNLTTMSWTYARMSYMLDVLMERLPVA